MTKKQHPQFDCMYELLSNAYGDKMLEREHFNDIVTNIKDYALRLAKAELEKERKENEKEIRRLYKMIDSFIVKFEEIRYGVSTYE